MVPPGHAWPDALKNFPISSLYFLPRLQRRDAAAGRSPRLWVSITNPLGRRGPHVASVPSIWSERSTRCGAQSAVGRAKKASIRIGGRSIEPRGARAGQNRARRVARAVPRGEAHRTKMGDVHAEHAMEALIDPTHEPVGHARSARTSVGRRTKQRARAARALEGV